MSFTFLGTLLSGIFLGGGVLASKISASSSSPKWFLVAIASYTASYSLFYLILRTQPVTIISPAIQALSILSTVCMAAFFLGEHITLLRGSAYALILVGLGLLVWGEI